MPLNLRPFSALVLSAALVVTVSGPAAAGSISYGEVLTSSGTDCGVLTITPNAPGTGDEVTVTLTGAAANSNYPVSLAFGIYADDRWFPIATNSDPEDGQVDRLEGLSTLSLQTDANGSSTRTGTVKTLLIGDGNDIGQMIYLSVVPTLWILDCDAGVTFAGVRTGRTSVPGTITLDPEVPGALIGSGLPASAGVLIIRAGIDGYPDPGAAIWSQTSTDDESALSVLEIDTDADGNLASTMLPGLSAPGRYALGVVTQRSEPFEVLKAEYLLTVADDLSMTLEPWIIDAPAPDLTPQTVTWLPANTSAAAATGSLEPSGPAQTDGTGTISYSVVDSTTTNCVVNPSTAALTFDTAGDCVVRASASATNTHRAAMTEVTFTVAPDPTALELELGAVTGEQVADTDVSFGAAGLKSGSAWSLTVRSTPTVIGSGTVGPTGRITGTATLPAGLETGWHSLTFSSTDAAGGPVDTMTWFEIGSAGELLAVSAVAPPVIPVTPVTPIVPVIPVTPVTPIVPVTPVTPVIPVTPVTPGAGVHSGSPMTTLPPASTTPALAATGANPRDGALAGAALLMAGLIIVLRGRRRSLRQLDSAAG